MPGICGIIGTGSPARRAAELQLGTFGRGRFERELQWFVVGRNLIRAYASLKIGGNNSEISAPTGTEEHS